MKEMGFRGRRRNAEANGEIGGYDRDGDLPVIIYNIVFEIHLVCPRLRI